MTDTCNQTISDTLAEAAVLMAQRGKATGCFVKSNGSVCAMGAVRLAMGQVEVASVDPMWRTARGGDIPYSLAWPETYRYNEDQELVYIERTAPRVDDNNCTEMDYLSRAVRQLYPERVYPTTPENDPFGCISDFNDNARTTEREVIEALELASKLAKEDGR